ncbi:Uncharacterized protein DBV15_00947 [Temnothorax longispinosus]|uniref:Uncharacterized protein n=1 Tax=Temnothorax longispinosus TaxID=300112 RepID=A0A4V3S6A7_9HYME|nr:Uncharacterized protein DBV15_00947 [Temnothorax longispinosus]
MGQLPGLKLRGSNTLGHSGFPASSLERAAPRRAGSQERRGNRHDVLGELQFAIFIAADKITATRSKTQLFRECRQYNGKRERVHATKARAYTRSRRTVAARRDAGKGAAGGVSEDRERQKWKRTVASRTRVSCGASTRHYAIRFGQPPVEKAPSWSWISITVVMATAIDSTGVRVDGEENGENERAGERTTADGRRGGQGLNSTGQFYGVGLEIRRSFEASHPGPSRLGKVARDDQS